MLHFLSDFVLTHFWNVFNISHNDAFCKCDQFFFKFDLLLIVWPIFQIVTHFSQCDPFFTVSVIFPNVTHFSKEWPIFLQCDTFLLTDYVTSMSLVGSRMALTHSILINLFIKTWVKQFSPASPTKYCFCPRVFSRLQEGFWRGEETRKAYITFLLEKWRVWVRVSRAHEVGHFGFMFFSFVNM